MSLSLSNWDYYLVLERELVNSFNYVLIPAAIRFPKGCRGWQPAENRSTHSFRVPPAQTICAEKDIRFVP